MSKWKCEICGNGFDNFQAQGFDNKIYCPLCYFKKLSADLQIKNEELKKKLEENKNPQQEFIDYLEKESNEIYRDGGLRQNFFKQVLQKYKNIIGGNKDEK